MVRFLFLQSEGLTNHLAVGNDAPNRLEGLVFGGSRSEHLAELYGLVKVGGKYSCRRLEPSVDTIPPMDMDGSVIQDLPGFS